MIEEFYKKKVIRDFLSLFSETKWKELIFLCLEYGIIFLKRNYNVASLSLDDLNNILDDLKEEENKRIKKNLKKFDVEYNSERKRSGSNTKMMVNKPPSDWRKGDDSIYEQSKEEILIRNESKERKIATSTLEKVLKRKGDKEEVLDYSKNKIYPEWWGDVKKRSYKKRTIKNEKNRSTSNRKSQKIRKEDGYYSETSGNRIKNTNSSKEKINAYVSTTNPHFDKRKIMETESKIKSCVQTDKKIFKMLKNQNIPYPDSQESQYEHQEFNENYQDYEEHYENVKNNFNEEYQQDEDTYKEDDTYQEACNGYEDKINTISEHKNATYNKNANYENYSNRKNYSNEESIQREQGRSSKYPNNLVNDSNNQSFPVRSDDLNIYNYPKNSKNIPQQNDDNTYSNQNYNNGNNSYFRESQSSMQNQINTQNDSTLNSEKKKNYLIEFDKNFKPQVIKEKDMKIMNVSVSTNREENSTNRSLHDREGPQNKNIRKQILNKNMQMANNSNIGNEYYSHNQPNLKKQVFIPSNKRVNSNLENSNLHNYSRNFPIEAYNMMPTETSQFEQNNYHNSNFNKFIQAASAFDSVYSQNRNEDTILREQSINKYINKNNSDRNANNSMYRRIPSTFTNNFYSNEEDLNLSVNNSNLNLPMQIHQQMRDSPQLNIENNSHAHYQPKSNREDELISPHFNYSARYNREEEVRQETNQNTCSNQNQYIPFTIQNEEFVKSPNNQKNFSACEENDLNESDRLSSYTPSERTKNFFQKEIGKDNLNDSRQSAYKNPNKIIVNTSNINDSINDSKNNSMRMEQNKNYIKHQENKQNFYTQKNYSNSNVNNINHNNHSNPNLNPLVYSLNYPNQIFEDNNIYEQKNHSENKYLKLNQHQRRMSNSGKDAYIPKNVDQNKPQTIISPTKLTDKELIKYASSGEDEVYVNLPNERVRSLHLDDMKKSNISNDDDNNDLKYFNNVAEDLNNRIKNLMTKK